MRTSAERLEWALTICLQSQLRMTPIRSAILTLLAERRIPMSFDQVLQIKGVRDCYDAATVYRTLMTFKEAGLVRCMGLVRCVGALRKSSHFVLNVPGDASPFLICERCGAMVELELPSSTLTTIQRVAAEHGFVRTPRSLELQSICQACDTAIRKTAHSSKLLGRSQG
jgi:Fe2+ or Zn2+ uptake regulation protein